MGEQREGLVSLIGTRADLKAWTPKLGQNQNIAQIWDIGLGLALFNMKPSEVLPSYIIPCHLFLLLQKKDKLHSPTIKELFYSGPYEST